MPVDLIITPPPTIVLRVQPNPRIVIRVAMGGGGGGGGGGSINEITSVDGSVDISDPTGPAVDLSVPDPTPADIGAVPTARTLTAGTGLTGGGDLSADRTLAADFGTGAGKITQGNDSRLSDARAPTGAAGGDLSGTYPNPTVAKTYADWWGPEETPNGLNEEFDTASPPGFVMWDLQGGGGSVPVATASSMVVDGINGPASNAVAYLSNPLGRRSWALMQSGVTGNTRFLYAKPFTLPAVQATYPYIIRARVRVALSGTTVNNDAGNAQLYLVMDDGAGKPKVASGFPDDMIRIGFEHDANSTHLLAGYRSAGSFFQNSLSANYWQMLPGDTEFVAVKLPGTSSGWEMWFRSGAYSWFATFGNAAPDWGSSVHVGIFFDGKQAIEWTTTPIIACDYIRHSNDRYWYR